MCKIIFKYKILVFLIGTLSFTSCSLTKSYKLLKRGEFVESEFKHDIKFRYVNSLILVDIQIEEKMYTFVLDTGAEISLVDNKLLNDLEHIEVAKKNVTGASGIENKFKWIEIPKILIGNLEFNSLIAISSDFSPIDNLFKCEERIHGVIGSNLMRKAQWRINYQNQIISIGDKSSKFEFLKNGMTFKLDCGKVGEANITVSLNGVANYFTFDTGAAIKIQTNLKTFDKLISNNSDLEYTQLKGATGLTLNGIQFGTTNFTLIEELRIGELLLENQIVEIEENASSLIGNEFWENFIITIDWDNCNLYLNPIQEIESDSLVKFKYDISVNSSYDGFLLRDEWLQHSDDLNIHVNNEITHIQGIAVSNLNSEEYCNFLINTLPSIKKQESISVTLLNNGIVNEINLRKEKLIPKR